MKKVSKVISNPRMNLVMWMLFGAAMILLLCAFMNNSIMIVSSSGKISQLISNDVHLCFGIVVLLLLSFISALFGSDSLLTYEFDDLMVRKKDDRILFLIDDTVIISRNIRDQTIADKVKDPKDYYFICNGWIFSRTTVNMHFKKKEV